MLQNLARRTLVQSIFYLILMIMLQQSILLSSAIAGDDAPIDDPTIWLPDGIPIESQSPPPESKQEKGWLSRNKWWVALGTIVLGGAIAGLAASGGEDGEGNNNSEEVGDYNVEW